MPATRRDFITGVGAALGTAAFPAGDAFATDKLTSQGRRLAGLLSLPEAARSVANVYLETIGETDWRRAAEDLDMAAVLAPAERITDTESLRTWLGVRIRADFAAGAVVDVDGWRLSRTEVGACLLAMSAA